MKKLEFAKKIFQDTDMEVAQTKLKIDECMDLLFTIVSAIESSISGYRDDQLDPNQTDILTKIIMK
jgi:hypothetical protein